MELKLYMIRNIYMKKLKVYNKEYLYIVKNIYDKEYLYEEVKSIYDKEYLYGVKSI